MFTITLRRAPFRFFCILTAVLCLAMGSGSAGKKAAEEGLPVCDGYCYRVLGDGTAEIVEYDGKEHFLTIPETLDGYTVTSIGDEAFYNYRYSIGSAVIPGTVTHIGSRAFSMTEIEELEIPASVVTMGDNPFGFCEDLAEIRVEEGNPVFYTEGGVLFCRTDSGLVCYPAGADLCEDTYTVPDGTKKIYGSAFGAVDDMTAVELPESLTEIGQQAFGFCWSLERIVIPDSVTEIGDAAFDSCKALSTAVLPAGLTRIGAMMFYECGDLETADIPETVTEIGESAFAYCASLKEIRIPAGLREISDGAFGGCEQISSAVIPEGVTKIGGYAFEGCFRLSEIQIPDSVTEIGDQAFQYCGMLHSLTIPDSVTLIGSDVFFDCPEDLVITGGAGSFAQSYCEENGISFRVK